MPVACWWIEYVTAGTEVFTLRRGRHWGEAAFSDNRKEEKMRLVCANRFQTILQINILVSGVFWGFLAPLFLLTGLPTQNRPSPRLTVIKWNSSINYSNLWKTSRFCYMCSQYPSLNLPLSNKISLVIFCDNHRWLNRIHEPFEPNQGISEKQPLCDVSEQQIELNPSCSSESDTAIMWQVIVSATDERLCD